MHMTLMKQIQIICALHLFVRTTSFVAPRSKSPWRQHHQHQYHQRNQPPHPPTTATATSLHDHSLLFSSLDLSTSFLHGGSSIAQSYMQQLRTNPIMTKSATAAVLASTGDAIAQFRSKEAQDSYNPYRGITFLLFGALYTGVFQHYWFDFLNSHIVDWGEGLHVWGHPAETDIPVQYFVQHCEEWWQYFDVKAQIADVMNTLQDPPTDAEIALAKVALNQFVVVPTFYWPLFFAITGVLGGLDVQKSIARAESLFIPLLKRNYLYWLPVQFVQFFVLPVDLQIPFVSVASLVWTIILSSIAAPAAPSTIVAYEETVLDEGSGSNSDVMVLSAVPVEPDSPDLMMDNVRLEDVTDALVPDAVQDVAESVGDALQEPRLGASAGGFALGLLAAAADEGGIGATVGEMLGGTDVGVAVVMAVGAGVGYLTATAEETNDDEGEEEEETDDDIYDATILQHVKNIDSEQGSMGEDAMGSSTSNSDEATAATSKEKSLHGGQVPSAGVDTQLLGEQVVLDEQDQSYKNNATKAEATENEMALL